MLLDDITDYSEVTISSYDKKENLQKFLEMNTLDTVFDLEETPTQFSYFVHN